MTAVKIDVKSIGGPYNLGRVEKWSEEDQDFLISQGATKNEAGFLHIPLALIEGQVLLGIGQSPPPGPPCELRIGGCLLKIGKKRSSIID